MAKCSFERNSYRAEERQSNFSVHSFADEFIPTLGSSRRLFTLHKEKVSSVPGKYAD